MTDSSILLGEQGRDSKGNPRTVDTRLFIQLQAFGHCLDVSPVIGAVDRASKAGEFEGVIYLDINDPRGIAILAAHEDPEYFVSGLRGLLTTPAFRALEPKPEYTMLGRTYSIGYEVQLEDILLDRPRRRMRHPEFRWAIWYPLRRSGSFELLSAEEQREILKEHAGIGISFSNTGYAQDIRLACHGIDKDDNDFVIGLIGTHLYPLSAMVQTMRKTKQTSTHLDRLGPFFVGRTAWQSPALPSPSELAAAHGKA